MCANRRGLFLGIDWGTHSSKWSSCYGGSGKYFDYLPIYSSDLLNDEGSLLLCPPEEKVTNEDDLVRGLKKALIIDPPGASFLEIRPS